jgi:hypothetical protein
MATKHSIDSREVAFIAYFALEVVKIMVKITFGRVLLPSLEALRTYL